MRGRLGCIAPLTPLTVIPALCLVMTVLPMVLNNLDLQRFAEGLFSYPLPPRTEELARRADVGLLGGNGNHCDFVASRVLVTDLSRDEIEVYYREVLLPAVSGPSESVKMYGTKGLLPVELTFDEGPSADGRLHVTVTLADIGHPASDWRCW